VTPSSSRLLALTSLALTLAVGLIACGDPEGTPADRGATTAVAPEPSFPAVTDSVIGTGPAADWPTHGGNLANHRFSPLNQIDRSSVAELVPVWIRSTGIEGAFETTPLVVGNTMYITTSGGRVLALNAATGEELWRHEPILEPVALCCGPSNGGVAAYGNMVYVASLDARLVALDARSGTPVWETRLAEPGDGYSATMAPLAVHGRVYVGVAGERYGIRGFVAAFNAESGEELWRWHTVPSAEEGGWWGDWAEADPFGTPLNRDIAAERADSAVTAQNWRIGGGGVSSTPAYDRETDRLFINVGGPSPLMDRATRPGDNLYTGSIVALDATSGQKVWHAQYLPHDVWGLSGGSSPFLFDRGDDRYVGFAGRTGWLYVFDADSGRPILRSDNFVPQEGLFGRAPEEGGLRMAPGANGGNPGTGVAYDPGTGTAFVGGVHQPMVYSPGPDAYQPGQLWLGGDIRFPPGEDQWGTVTAIDLAKGEIRWQARTPAPVYSHVLATAGGLVFVGQGSGTLDALDARSGELLWQFGIGAGVHGGPITYSVQGVQYVVAPAGGSFHFDPAPGDDLIAFALASERPRRGVRAYGTPGYERGGPASATRGAVRQLDAPRSEAPPADGDGDR